jgi:hypothetical protein
VRADGRPLFYQYMADKPRTVFFDEGLARAAGGHRRHAQGHREHDRRLERR